MTTHCQVKYWFYLRLGPKAQQRAPKACAFHIVILVLFAGFATRAVAVVSLINSGRKERAFRSLPTLTSTCRVARFERLVCDVQNGNTHALPQLSFSSEAAF